MIKRRSADGSTIFRNKKILYSVQLVYLDIMLYLILFQKIIFST